MTALARTSSNCKRQARPVVREYAPHQQIRVETLPLFLVTLTRNIKSQEIYKLNSLNHITIKTELSRAETGFTQCYNCHSFGHVWANCKQSFRYLWCGGGRLRRECPEKKNAESSLSCCNCILVGGEKLHPVSYRGCSYAKGNCKGEDCNGVPRDPLGGLLL
jgi:hypothetical protein